VAVVTDPRTVAPDCPLKTCSATVGDVWCYTPTGFRRHWHAARRAVVAGATAPAVPAAGKLAGRRPSEAQQRILAAAMAGGGMYELSGYTFHGDAQRRAAMTAMADQARGWFRQLHHTDHGTMFEITDTGRNAYYRYKDWMNGGPTK
jgi:hypothetical protein